MIDINKQYKTRDGREVRIYAMDGGGECPVHGAALTGRRWTVLQWSADGRIFQAGTSNNDLIEAKPTRTVWINIYESHTGSISYATKNQADNATCEGRIACVPITFTEGEGL